MKVSSNVGAMQPLDGETSNSSNTLLGRTWKVIYHIPDAAAKTATSTDGVYKFAKVIKTVCNAAMVLFNDMNLAVAAPYSAMAKELESIISPATVSVKLHHFVSGDFLKKDDNGHYKYSIWKNLNAASLVILKSTEGLIWIKKQGVDLGQLAMSVGGTPLYRLTSGVAVMTFKNTFTITASVLAIIEVASSFVKHCKDPAFKADPMAKQVLTLINESGKIVLTVMSAYFFTYTFAALALLTAGSGMAKFLFGVYYNPKPAPSPLEVAKVA